MSIEDLLAELLGGNVVTGTAEDIASATRAVRAALGKLVTSPKPAHQAAGQAVYDYYLLGRRPGRGERFKGLRLIRGNKTVRAALGRLNTGLTLPWNRPRGEWGNIEEVARETGYDPHHLANWVLDEHPEVRHVKAGDGRIYVHRKDVQAYARRQKSRGYGPR